MPHPLDIKDPITGKFDVMKSLVGMAHAMVAYQEGPNGEPPEYDFVDANEGLVTHRNLEALQLLGVSPVSGQEYFIVLRKKN